MRSLLGTSLRIEQSEKQAFNLDTVLLASFLEFPAKTSRILDIGTGAGALILYASQKTKAKIAGIEIQKERYEQAKLNVEINQLTDQIEVIYGDVKDYQSKSFDCIISNPPFFKVTNESKLSESIEDQIARHEIHLTLEEFAKHASRLLKYGGKLFFIHRPDRLSELITTLKKYHLEVKRIRFVHPYVTDKANHVLIEASKNGHAGLKIEPPLIVYDKRHELSEEMIKIYGGNPNVT